MNQIIAVFALLICLPSMASQWVIHGALGTNPGIGFSRIAASGDHIEILSFEYGVDPSFSFNADEWCVSSGVDFSVFSTGATLTLDESWGTAEIPYSPNYGTSSAILWAIEDGAPDFNGASSQVAPETPGEYWVDWSSVGHIRISPSLPDDFGKWLSDGSINPNYVAPLATKKHHGKK